MVAVLKLKNCGDGAPWFQSDLGGYIVIVLAGVMVQILLRKETLHPLYLPIIIQ